MKNKIWYLILMTACFLCLTGCFFQSADELYALPKSSETYVNLQEKIKEVKGDADYIAPQSGNNTQTIQLIDLNQDGEQEEAVAFFRDSTAEKPLKIYIFKQNGQGIYKVYASIEGAAEEIDSIDYCNLDGTEEAEIIVSWKVSTTVKTLVAYSVSDQGVVELMRSGYTEFQLADLDQDDQDEILLVQLEESDPESNRVEMYASLDGAMQLCSSAPLSQEILEVNSLQKGCLKGKVPAVFVNSSYEENGRITDVFYVEKNTLHNVTMDILSGKSTQTLRYFTSVEPTDINQDGITEIPHSVLTPSNHESSEMDNIWKIEWKQYDKNGVATPTMTTLHNSGDRWYLVLPGQWKDSVTLSRQENRAIGEQGVVFSYSDKPSDTEPIPFLTIYRLTGTNRVNRAKLNNRFVLWTDGETIYAGEFLGNNWNCGLDKDALINRFHLIRNEWIFGSK